MSQPDMTKGAASMAAFKREARQYGFTIRRDPG
jgi:hypothetical protein